MRSHCREGIREIFLLDPLSRAKIHLPVTRLADAANVFRQSVLCSYFKRQEPADMTMVWFLLLITYFSTCADWEISHGLDNMLAAHPRPSATITYYFTVSRSLPQTTHWDCLR